MPPKRKPEVDLTDQPAPKKGKQDEEIPPPQVLPAEPPQVKAKEEEEDQFLPECPFGADCTKVSEKHRKEYKHPKAEDPEEEHRKMKEKIREKQGKVRNFDDEERKVAAPPRKAAAPPAAAPPAAAAEFYNAEALEYMRARPSRKAQSSRPTEVSYGGFTTEELLAGGYKNETDDRFDLGKDGAFSAFSVGIYMSCEYFKAVNTFGPALEKKGFKVEKFYKKDITKFIHCLNELTFDVIWIIPDQSAPPKTGQLAEAVMAFHKAGRGVMVWGDNAPLFADSNLILPELAGVKLVDDTPGDRVLAYGDGHKAGEFDATHTLFAGISYLYEGVTICYPVPAEEIRSSVSSSDTVDPTVGRLSVVATSSNGHPVICCMERSASGGRVVVDTGFTKLYDQFWKSEGQARYVVNACVYLVDIEGRFPQKDPTTNIS